MPTITCIEDLRRLYHRRVPKMFVDYAESGSWTEATLARNARALADIELRQRVAIDISERNVEGSMLGERWTLPVAIAPTGLMTPVR